jgi:DNA-binding XRE family transcriptional regulator
MSPVPRGLAAPAPKARPHCPKGFQLDEFPQEFLLVGRIPHRFERSPSGVIPEASEWGSGMMDQMGAEEPRVPNRVRELRENKLMTQAQLARKAKVALRTIHSVEKGMNCRMDTKRKILLALGLSFEDKDQVFPPVARSMPFPMSH